MNGKLVLAVAATIALAGLVGFGAAMESGGDTAVSDESDDEKVTSGEEVIENVLTSDDIETLQATVAYERDTGDEFGADEPLVEEIWLDGDQLRTDTYHGDELETVTILDDDEQLVHHVDDNEYTERTTSFNATDRHANPLPENEFDEIAYDVKLIGEERHEGHDTYHIQLEITDEDELEGVGEVTLDMWIEDEHWYPVTMTTAVSHDETEDDVQYAGEEFEMTVTHENLTLNEAVDDDPFDYELPEDAEERSTSPSTDRYDSADELNEASELNVTVPETLDTYEFHQGSVHSFDDNDNAYATYGEEHTVSVSITNQSYDTVDEDGETVTVNDREATVTTHSFGDTEYTSLQLECDGQTVTIGGELTEDEVIGFAEEIDC